MSNSHVAADLKAAGLGASHPRLKILTYLRANRNHPTAEQIYSALLPQMPTLSKMTVYNTLRAFVAKGLARDVRIEEGLVRYDSAVDDHGHFKCSVCGSVTDFFPSPALFEAELSPGFTITQKDIFFRGTCPKCSD